MAIHNDPRLYSGGSAIINEQPHVQLYANLLARQAARKDAFDEYMRNMNKGINAAGVRNVDRPAFDQKLSQWQQFGIDHANEIRKRQNGADIKFMNDYQDLQNLVGESKTEEEKKKPIVEMMLDPNKRDRLNNEDVINAIHQHDQPLMIPDDKGNLVRNPNRKSIDYTDVSFNPKPFEQDKYFKQFEDVKRSELPPTVVKNPKDMTQTVTTNSVFDKDAKDLIATRATSDYMNNPSFKDYVSKLNPDDYNYFFKQNYGRDISNPADLAAAFTLKGIQQKTTTSKFEPDVYARQLDLQKRTQGFQAWLKGQPTFGEKQKNKDDVLGAGNVLNEVKSILLNPTNIKSDEKGQNVELEISDPTVLKNFKGLSKVTADDPSGLGYNFKTNQLFAIFKDKDGNEVDRQELDPKTYLKLKVKESYPNKDIGNMNNMIDKFYEDNGGNLYQAMKSLDQPQKQSLPKATKYSIKGKTYSEKQLLDMGYSLDQIYQYKQ